MRENLIDFNLILVHFLRVNFIDSGYLFISIDIRGGGDSSTDAWNKGFFLSTSIEGALYDHNNRNSSGNQGRSTPKSNAASYGRSTIQKNKNIENHANYDYPDAPQVM